MNTVEALAKVSGNALARRPLPVTLAVTAVLAIGATIGVQQLLGPSLRVTDEFVGTVAFLNSDGTAGCITVSGENTPRCSAIYARAKLKVGDKVHVWVEEVPASDNPQPTYNPDISAGTYLVVAEPS